MQPESGSRSALSLKGSAAPIVAIADEEKARPMPNPVPCAIVIFGASGDLAQLKLIPAIYELCREKLLSDRFVLVGIAVVAILLIALPAYRWFFLISVLIGVVIAGGLALWHKLRPIEEQDLEQKRPLGL